MARAAGGALGVFFLPLPPPAERRTGSRAPALERARAVQSPAARAGGERGLSAEGQHAEAQPVQAPPDAGAQAHTQPPLASMLAALPRGEPRLRALHVALHGSDGASEVSYLRACAAVEARALGRATRRRWEACAALRREAADVARVAAEAVGTPLDERLRAQLAATRAAVAGAMATGVHRPSPVPAAPAAAEGVGTGPASKPRSYLRRGERARRARVGSTGVDKTHARNAGPV